MTTNTIEIPVDEDKDFMIGVSVTAELLLISWRHKSDVWRDHQNLSIEAARKLRDFLNYALADSEKPKAYY